MIKKTNKRSLFEKKFVPLHPKCGNMCSLESLKIDLKGLSEEETLLEFDLSDNYFEALDGAETKRGSLHVSVSIRKATALCTCRCLYARQPAFSSFCSRRQAP